MRVVVSFDYLKQRGKGGNWSFYRRVPADVRPVVGQAFWEESLKTRDRRLAEKLVRPRASETDAIIDRVRRMLPKEKNEIVAAGGAKSLATEVADDAKQSRFLAASLDMADSADSRPDREDGADELLNRVQVARKRMDRAAGRAELAELRRIIGEKVEVLARVGLEIDSAEASIRGGARGLEEVLASLIKAKDLPSNTQRQYGYAVRRFNEINGNVALVELTRDMLKKFSDTIAELPSNPKLTKLPFRNAIEARRAEDAPPISNATRTKHVATLRTLSRYALAEGWLTTDPFHGFRQAVKRKKAHQIRKDRRQPFSHDELEKVVAALNTQTRRVRPDDFWISHVALWHGAREEEICQLDRADVKMIDNIPCIEFTDEGDKRLKNYASLRTVPVHPELVRLGFIDFVKKGKAEKLFASLTLDADGRYGSKFGKRFARILDKLGITDSRKVFHSFRHNWTDAARNALVPPEIRYRLAGREDREAGSENDYGHGDYTPSLLLDWLGKVRPL